MKNTNRKALGIAKQLIEKNKIRRAREEGASKMATLGEMASGIAHEINNPVAIICGFASKLEILSSKDEFEKEKFVEISQKINSTGLRISKIIKGLKSYSRDASLDPMQTESIGNIIEETLSLCSEKFKNHRVDLILPQDLTELSINCRSVEISQVLLNLLNNSYDAIEMNNEKWISLDITKNDDYLDLIISDSGKIDVNIAKKIFIPFYTTKEIGKGTGLGLSICYGIIKKHGGEIFIDTEKENTTFVIRLPIECVAKDSNEEE